MRLIFSLLFAAAVLIPIAARAEIYSTNVELTNSTGKDIYVASFSHYGRHIEWGLVRNGSSVLLRDRYIGTQFFMDVHVYVKSAPSAAPEYTICTAATMFDNTGTKTKHERVRYDGNHCWFEPA